MSEVLSLEEKKKKLAKLVGDINKKYSGGKDDDENASCICKKASDLENIEGIPTGMVSLDMALGCNGFPRGRIIEISGREHSGKTSLALEAIANAQRLDESSYSIYLDLENGLDKKYAKSIGVDLDRLQVVEPIPAEQVCNLIRDVCNSGIFDYIVVDSTSAMSPSIEQGKAIDVNAQVASTAKLLSSLCRQIVGPLGKSKSCLIFISQIRKKITANPYENPDVIGHGESLKYYTSVRISVLKQKEEDGSEDCPRNPTVYTIFKNKCGGKPKAKVEEVIVWGKGIDKESDVLLFCMKSGVINRSGAIYKYIDSNGEEHKWKGQNAVKAELLTNDSLKNEILEKAKVKYIKDDDSEIENAPNVALDMENESIEE